MASLTVIVFWFMLKDMKLPVAITQLSPEEITDCIDRLVLGMDTNDAKLFDPALAQNVQWVLHIKTLVGLQAIHEQCFDSDITKLDTTQYVTNMRIHVEDEESKAAATTLYEAHH
ncbi:hypothetical protein GQX73_g6839 [Xylaria multiplex]|uniref:SnoaL-like domain-containing protein n=1 Tax=Xylaria multiplex TaxID=323545 RepID=A0A7C8MRV2_9PEZI|nr:hypothetical protein GQX73_g6839 [Xylaria multiplex]